MFRIWLENISATKVESALKTFIKFSVKKYDCSNETKSNLGALYFYSPEESIELNRDSKKYIRNKIRNDDSKS